MSFRSSGSNDLGRWVGVGYDEENTRQVLFRLRRLSDDERKDIEKKLGKFQRDPNTGVKTRVIPPKKLGEAGYRMAFRIWTGTQNCSIKLTDQKAVNLYSKALGKSGLKVGDEVCVDGDEGSDHPPEAIKRDILRHDVGLANLISREGFSSQSQDIDVDDDEEEQDESDSDGEDYTSSYPEDEREEDLKKTSSSPSSSTSDTPTSESS